MSDYIYFDNAATTLQDLRVTEVMLSCMNENFGNPSAQYGPGFAARRIISNARENAASLIGAKADEVIFTSGGTESDNQALSYMHYFEKGKNLVVSAVEHPAILNTCKRLESFGYKVHMVKPDCFGTVHAEEIEKAIDGNTVMVSVMMANNEVGTVMPVRSIAETAHRHGCIFHTDAVQALGIIPIDVHDLGIDLLSGSGHKLYGPKGSGLLFVRSGLNVPCLIEGGGQENGFRSGTENVPAIRGFGEACRIASEELTQRSKYESELRNHIASRILSEIPDATINGVPIDESYFNEQEMLKRLPGNLHVSFKGVNGVSLRILLDMKNICVSTGSACSASNEKHSHVLDAMGLPDDITDSSLRITVGKNNTMEETDRFVDILKESVFNVRRLMGGGN